MDQIITEMNGIDYMDGKEKRLNQIFTEIKQLDPSILPDLNAMIRLYSQAQLVIGHLDADALYRYGEAYTKRKSAYAEAIENGHGTVAEKEADIRIFNKRKMEFFRTSKRYFNRLLEWHRKRDRRRNDFRRLRNNKKGLLQK